MWSVICGANSNTSGATPVGSAVSTSLTTVGACNGGGGVSVYGTYTTTWTMTNADSTGAYVSKVYINGVYSTQLANTVTSIVVTAPGVEDDSRHIINVDKTYRIDVVRVSDSQVMNTTTGNRYQDSFGDCTGPF